MKKIVLISATMIMVMAFCLVGCGGNSSGSGSGGSDAVGPVAQTGSQFIGTWMAKEMEVKGERSAVEEEFDMILNEDGTGEIEDEDGPDKFTWEDKDGRFITHGNVEFEGTLSGGNTLKADLYGFTFVFERK